MANPETQSGLERPVRTYETAMQHFFALRELNTIVNNLGSDTIKFYLGRLDRTPYMCPADKVIELRTPERSNVRYQTKDGDNWFPVDDGWCKAPSEFYADTLEIDSNNNLWVADTAAKFRIEVMMGSGQMLIEAPRDQYLI